MSTSPSALSKWLDRDFYELGAFISSETEIITFGKGGHFTLVDKFIESSDVVFYLKDFYKNSYLAYTPAETFKASKLDVLNFLNTLTVSQDPISPLSNDDDLYQKDFRLLKSAFKDELQKVVLISREEYDSFEGEKTIQRLFKKSFEFGAGLPYGLWNKQYGVIGSTPETLYDVQDNILKTFALAGTAKRGSEVELLKSKKDRHEHDLVIKDIAEKLSKFTTDLHTHETEIYGYKSIVHLKTNLEAKVNSDLDFTELTNTMSPTAALGGYPKTESLNFLRGTHYSDKHPARYFGSCFGLMSPTEKHFVVSIRNVQWENQHLFIESGGGIVPESQFEKELEEIHLKRNTIRNHYL